MLFGKHINRYYIRHGFMLLLGVAALVLVDFMQLIIPNLYQMLVNGVCTVNACPVGQMLVNGVCVPVAQPGVPGVGPAPVPVDNPWALGLLAAAMAAFARRRRK